MTTAAHPYSKVEPLLCSTRCQVVVEHETEHALLRMKTFPIVMIIKILEYVSYSREEENALPQHDVITRWKVFAFTKDANFLERALATDLFRFATHGIEDILPPDLGERVDFLVRRIDRLYPKEEVRCDFSVDERCRFTISALDLARVETVTHPPSKFDPYKPLNWSSTGSAADGKHTYNTDNNNQAFWEGLGLVDQNLTASEYPQPYCPSVGQQASIILAPFRLNQTSFCPINVHSNGGTEAISLDGFHIVPFTSFVPRDNISYLPIANAAINRASKHSVTYGLINSRNTQGAFKITMVLEQWPPKPAATADAPKKKSECTIL